jgi:broad specificity phosphatase PhoE
VKVVDITFFPHATTLDNEKKIATGWSSTELSDLGRNQAKSLRKALKNISFDLVFCSDLKRAFESAKIGFGYKSRIIQDPRLRECDYGDLTGNTSSFITEKSFEYTDKPFPKGESYLDVEKRVGLFLESLLPKYNGKKVAIVAHRATQLALEVLINKQSWKNAFENDWRVQEPKKWQLGWNYVLK